MNTFKKIFGAEYVKVKLALLWLFVMLNYIYADIMALMDVSVLEDILSDALGITPLFLFLGAFLMEIPIAMVFLSLMLRYRINRWANIIAGVIKTLAVLGSMFVGEPALYYTFFVVVEIIATSYIVYIAWKWSE